MARISLEDEIRDALNRHSAENDSNTPDFILAEFLMGCLTAWNIGVVARTKWYEPRPSSGKGNSASAPPPAAGGE